MGGLFGSSDAQSLVNSNAWGNDQSQMANYTYDPNDPDKWSRLVGQTSDYQGQTANTGSAGGQSFGDWLMSKEGAKALQDTGSSLKDPQSNAAPKGSTLTPAQMPGGSQAVRGNTQTLSQILQLLNSRRYSPIGYSGGGSSTRGLMGY
jgi:hypothetical protein